MKPGSDVDGFTIGRRIHAGGMGDIFQVTRPGDGRRMIMKVPRVGPNEPAEAIISFETEATIVPVLRGPHVPAFVAIGDLARTPYLVTEWIDGPSLEAVLRGGRLPVVEVARIGAAIADALHSLHQQDVIHLDLKPANVILKKNGLAALIDFGFAHHVRYPDLLMEETRFGAGSAPYISPEQILGTREDPRADIFSLGVVLYEMATGALPFGEPDTDVRNRLWLDPIPPSGHSSEVPPWLQEIILRCLEPKPEARYQSAALVAFDLRNPKQVELTARATKSGRARFFQQVRRFLKARTEYGRRLQSPHMLVSRSPIIMVAVDTTHIDDERQQAIQRATAQVLSVSKEFRLICVSVIPSGPPADEAKRQLEHRIRLRHWIEPLKLPPHRLSLHAIESSDAPPAHHQIATTKNVDLIILGAPGPTQPERSWWNSVASTVTANAHCSVHVVRVSGRAGAALAAS